jgi:hypothetical protein
MKRESFSSFLSLPVSAANSPQLTTLDVAGMFSGGVSARETHTLSDPVVVCCL